MIFILQLEASISLSVFYSFISLLFSTTATILLHSSQVWIYSNLPFKMKNTHTQRIKRGAERIPETNKSMSTISPLQDSNSSSETHQNHNPAVTLKFMFGFNPQKWNQCLTSMKKHIYIALKKYLPLLDALLLESKKTGIFFFFIYYRNKNFLSDPVWKTNCSQT